MIGCFIYKSICHMSAAEKPHSLPKSCFDKAFSYLKIHQSWKRLMFAGSCNSGSWSWQLARGSQVHTAPLTLRAGRNGPQGFEGNFFRRSCRCVHSVGHGYGDIMAQTWARTAAHTSLHVREVCIQNEEDGYAGMHMNDLECSHVFVRVCVCSSICLPFPRKAHLVQHTHDIINYSVEWTVVLDQAQPWPAHSLCNQMDRFAVFSISKNPQLYGTSLFYTEIAMPCSNLWAG